MRSEGGAERPLGVEFFGVDSLEDSALDIARLALLEAEGGADFSSEADHVVPASDSVDLMLPFLDLLDVPEALPAFPTLPALSALLALLSAILVRVCHQ